jgi:hypothetical protein
MISTYTCTISLFLTLVYHLDVVQSCTTSCQQMPLHGFVSLAPLDLETSTAELREPTSVGSTESFRFLSFNAPNLLRIETNFANSIRIPSRDEIWDIVCSIQQMGGKVAASIA